MADQTSSSLVVAAAPDAVLAVIADLPAYPEWSGEIKRVEVLEAAPDGRPRRARFEISSSGLSDEYVLDYDWTADGVSWRLVAPSTLQKAQEGSYRLSPTAGGTQVRYDLRIDARLPMIGPMRRKIEKRIVEGALSELKRRVEALG
ncbi:MAG: SRPBCC family protein [Actinomycetota bacterium]|nr:SRPBCC family protein [Actinomycetota bacterium]